MRCAFNGGHSPPHNGQRTNFNGAQMSDRLLPQSEVLKRVPFTRGSIYNWRKAGKFPQPVRIGNRLAWRESAIEDWIADREAESHEVSA